MLHEISNLQGEYTKLPWTIDILPKYLTFDKYIIKDSEGKVLCSEQKGSSKPFSQKDIEYVIKVVNGYENLKGEIVELTAALKQLIGECSIFLGNPGQEEAFRRAVKEVRGVLEKYEGGVKEC